ncbi:sirohydrochlorin ferrochelatase [Melghirimyces profundicolus]|uniref:Sirohydrochlorin ferrochelatase n=1 Tax=Melghirimyces profundicolus TaxID=1242148 RepID=A0A2T6C4X8_9BACL|nr:CbiX/SirB N-terminal domain-containing protein [Melghirimyces profundicolus]PTX63333.1 sirohydrochlorin ferrochelatase [Melghirimyces profundicolus]
MTTGKEGVLVLAHGSRDPEWNRLVEEAVERVDTDLPITVGCLELVKGRLIPDGVRYLEEQGVKRIWTVPLFVSSGSTHLEEIRYALGVTDRSRVATDLSPIRPRAGIVWCRAMDDHPLILKLLEDRVREWSERPEEEHLLLAAHGSNKPGFREIWEKGLTGLAGGLRERFGFPVADYAMLQVGDVREKAEALSRKRRLLVLPVFLSRGYFTDVLLRRELEGVDCVYPGETYLPHPLVTRWIEETVREKR